MVKELFHDFGQNLKGQPMNADVRVSLPNMFELIEERDGVFSNPDQIVGIFTRNRVFGGQTFKFLLIKIINFLLLVTQFYIYAKKLIGEEWIKRIDITFYGPGNAILPIHYKEKMMSTESKCISMEASQNGKIIARSNVRFTKSEPFDFMPKAPSHLPRPLDCPTLKEAKSTAYLNPWIIKYGNSLNTTKLRPHSELFELRPVDFESFAGLNGESKKMQCWARLTPHLHHVDIKEPMFVPLTVCDYLACHPAITALDQRRLYFKSGASLTHKVCIHRTSGFDPYGFFLVENSLDSLSNEGIGLYSGQVFDEAGNCILTFSQMNFNLIEMEEPAAKI